MVGSLARRGLQSLSIVALVAARAGADPAIPDPPVRQGVPTVGPSGFAKTSDLNGLYLWLGPLGAASYVDADWDSTIGADATLLRVRESALAVIGGSFGGSRWTERGGGRLWVDAIAGTRWFGRIVGVSAGPIVELADLEHPRFGASLGIWAFVGIAPYVRVGSVQELGTFGEVGIHIALPVYRFDRARAGARN